MKLIECFLFLLILLVWWRRACRCVGYVMFGWSDLCLSCAVYFLRSIDGNSMAHSWHHIAMNGPAASLFPPPPPSHRTVIVELVNKVTNLKQNLLSFMRNTFPLFLSKMLNWAIESNLTLLASAEVVCCLMGV